MKWLTRFLRAMMAGRDELAEMLARQLGSRGDAALKLAGHYVLLAVWPMVITTSVVSDVLGRPGGWWSLLGTTSWLWLFGMWFGVARHDAGLCERCVASLPLDRDAAVARWRLALRAFHLPWVTACYLVAVLALGFLIRGRHSVGWYFLADAPVQLLLGAMSLMLYQHRRLRPYCPWCRWDHGGDHEEVPDRDPAVSR